MQKPRSGLIPTLFVSLVAACASGGVEQRPEPFAASLRADLVDETPADVENVLDGRLEALPEPRLLDIPYPVILDPDRPVEGSVSVGTASTGYLLAGRELPLDGDSIYVLSTHHARTAHYATDELADILERTGERLAARFPGTRVPLGDASGPEGGDILHHASHNSGRDIDVPFFVHSSTGRQLRTSRFVRFDATLRRGRVVFDIERNWFFMRYFLEESGGTTQWAFIARWLSRAMLDYAISIGEPKPVIEMAANVMWQPGDSAPHDDHFHLRIYCSRDDRLEGCVNYGYEWPWSERFDDVHEARVGELSRALDDDDVGVRVAAVEFLARINGRQLGPMLAGRLSSQPAEVQIAILAALQQFRTPRVGDAIIALVKTSDDDRVREAALSAAVAYPMPEAAEAFVAIAAEDCEERLPSGAPVCREAVRALLEIQDPDLVPALIPLLDSRDAEARVLTARVLERTTGRRDDVNWLWAGASTRGSAIADWWDWYEANEDAGRVEWLRASFGELGYDLPLPLASRAALEVLIDAMHDGEPVGYIANTLLREVTGERGPPDRWRHSRQRDYWYHVATRFD